MKYIGCIFSLILALPAGAAVPTSSPSAPVATILSGSGSTFGGIAGSGFTLLDLRRTADNKKKIERLVFDVGDQDGNILRGWPGYYHVELKNNPSRLVIDFAQMPNSKLSPTAIAQRLMGSLAVTHSELSLEPVDKSLNLTLNLKANTVARIYQVKGKAQTSKVVIDLIAK